MASIHDDTVPVWKKLFPIISGVAQNVGSEVFDQVLDLCKVKLIDVFVDYKVYTRKSYVAWLNEGHAFSGPDNEDMQNFMLRLSIVLDLETDIAFMVLSSYLTYDYYGKVDELKSIVRFENNVSSLVESIWHFYTGERMFILKTLRYILENAGNAKEVHHVKFQEFVNELDLPKLWTNLISTFQYLVEEIDKYKVHTVAIYDANHIEEWVHRNNREQCEVVLLMTLVLDKMPSRINEFPELVAMFMRHNFGRSQLFSEGGALAKPLDVEELKSAEMGCALLAASKQIAVLRDEERDDEIDLLPIEYERSLAMQLHKDEAIVLLAWLVIKHIANDDEDEAALEQYSNLCEALLQRRVFITLYGVLLNKVFQKSEVGFIVCQAVATILDEFWSVNNDNYFFYRQEGFVPTLALLMDHPKLIPFIDQSSLKDIFHLSLHYFPFDFHSFVKMSTSLVKDDNNYDKAMSLLRAMPYYLDDTPWPVDENTADHFHLLYDIVLGDSVIAPAGTTVTKINTTTNVYYCQYQFRYDFFTVFEAHVKKFLRNGEALFECKLFEKIYTGYRLLVAIAENYEGVLTEDGDIMKCLYLLDEIPKVFTTPNYFEVIKLYMNIKNALLINVGLSFEILFPSPAYRKFFPKLFARVPTGREITFTSFKEIFEGEIYFDSLICKMLAMEEQSDEHTLLLEYLRFLHHLTDKKQEHRNIQIPGLAYIISRVYPRYQHLIYRLPAQAAEVAHRVYAIFVKYIHQIPNDANATEEELESFTVYLKIFANDDWFISHFLNEFCRDKFYLQRVMLHECYWFRGAGYHCIEAFRMQLVLLLLIMKFKPKLDEHIRLNIDRHMPLIAKSVTVHMVNSYSTHLAALALRFLEILSQDENSPLMALLDLDHNQAQRTFLERLRDPLEDDDIKVRIIDLISSCVLHQHGITAAFFNVQCSKRWYENAIVQTDMQQDDMKDFMVDYFKNIKKSREYLHHPLQQGILRIMCYLWRSNKQNLIREMTSLDAFWSLMAQPLFQKVDQNAVAYGNILEIFSVHLSRTGDAKLVKVLCKFLNNETQMKAFSGYMLGLFQDTPRLKEQRDDRLYLLKSLTSLLMIFDRKMARMKNDNIAYKEILLELSFDGIALVTSDEKALVAWYKFGFMLLTQWGINPTKKTFVQLKPLIDKFQRAFEVIKRIYHTLPVSVRNIVLSIFKMIIDGGKEYFQVNTAHLWAFLNAFCIYMDYEYQQLSEVGWNLVGDDPVTARQHTIPWLICASVSNNLLKFQNVSQLSIWFRYRKYMDCLVAVTPHFIKHRTTFHSAKVAVHGMILYMAGPLHFDTCQLNLIKFYDDIEPLISARLGALTQKNNPRTMKDAWFLISLLVRFNRELLVKFQLTGMKTVCAFLMMFHNLITYTLTIPEFTVDLDALGLLKQTLIFFDDVLLRWRDEWYKKSNRTFNEDLTNVKKVINSCISAVLRPKSVVYYKMDDDKLVKYDNPTPKDIALVVNELIDILSVSSSVLSKVNPSLETMLDVNMPHDMYYSMIEHDFSVPKFDVPLTNELTYGRLLCLAHFLCKTSNQLQIPQPASSVQEEDNEPPQTAAVNSPLLDFLEHLHVHEPRVRLIGIVVADPRLRDTEQPNQKLSSFLSYTMYQYSGLTDPWIFQLDKTIVKNALENLIFFLAGQVFLHIRVLDQNQIPYFKRNLCSELQFFYEYVKKQAMDASTSRADTAAYYKANVDVLSQVMVSIKKQAKYNVLADEKFLVVLAQWFRNICALQ